MWQLFKISNRTEVLIYVETLLNISRHNLGRNLIACIVVITVRIGKVLEAIRSVYKRTVEYSTVKSNNN